MPYSNSHVLDSGQPVQHTCLIIHILANGAIQMNKKHGEENDLLAQFDMWYLACFVLITFSKVGLWLSSVHPAVSSV